MGGSAVAGYAQEGCSSCDRGVDSAQLFEGNSGLEGGSGSGNPFGEGNGGGFDDVYVDMCRDIAYSDNLHSDPYNVLSTTFNQVQDVRGPVDCAGGCGGCPTHYFEGIYGKQNCLAMADSPPLPGASIGTKAGGCISGNAPVRTYTY
jgi:hypothetical protein